tara:strand:- start:198618 stop:199274 length:657 start_codon:yes stop_codon:yes gene_type:complete
MNNLSLAAAMEAFLTKPALLDVDAKKSSDKSRAKDKSKNSNPEHELPGRLDRLSQELTLFMAVDPVLSDLHKEYLDACGILDNLAVKNSSYDPMAVVASDRVESAHSAFSTRLIELRQDEQIQAMVQMKRHRLLLEEMEERKIKRRMLEEKAYTHRKDMDTVKAKNTKERKAFAFDIFMAYMMMSWAVHAQSRQELKYAFEDAFIGNVKSQKTGTASA